MRKEVDGVDFCDVVAGYVGGRSVVGWGVGVSAGCPCRKGLGSNRGWKRML